ncbi:MAG: tRNA (adenosine(37)-N6)-dimethylallyltransferase MiaA [Gemmatimonadaceae bacterium]
MAAAKIRIICGPTAAGKSVLAMELAREYGAAIISADSRQIYKGFDIGTAKPNASERSAARHYGIDIVEPGERYSAARWGDDARGWIEDANRLGTRPIVVGGTGLYVKSLVQPLFPAPPLDAVRRAELERELASKSVAELRRWCRELDASRAHLGRTQLLRALETAILSGSRVSDLHAAHNSREESGGNRLEPSYLVVDPGAPLATRIESRVDRMIARGWPEEILALSRITSPDAPAWKASGYAVMRSHVEGTVHLSSARERVIIETRQYAKRQRTWFRHQLPAAAVTHVNPDDSRAVTLAREWWERAE